MNASSIRNSFLKIERVILPTLGENIQAINITPARLDKYANARLKDGVKRTTIHREICDIRAILNWAAKPAQKYLTRNPMAGYEMPKRDDEVIRPPNKSEVLSIMAESPPHLIRALSLSYYTGLRPGRELFSLTWEGLDFDGGTIQIISADKGGLRYRKIPLHPGFVDVLKKWYHEDIDRGYPDDAPIVRWQGKAVKSVKTAYKNAKVRAGVTRRLRPYDLRHAFATNILEAGGDLKATSQLLGHTRPDTTIKTYQHVSAALTRDAINRLPEIDIPDPQTRKPAPPKEARER